MEIWWEKRARSFSSYKASSFSFHDKCFTVTPVTLESKIKEVFKTFFGALSGLWRTMAAGLDLSVVVAKKNRENQYFFLLEIWSLNSMHA